MNSLVQLSNYPCNEISPSGINKIFTRQQFKNLTLIREWRQPMCDQNKYICCHIIVSHWQPISADLEHTPCPGIHPAMAPRASLPSSAPRPGSPRERADLCPVLTLPQSRPVSVLTRPPYCSMGAGRTRPVTSVMSLWTTMPNSFR